MDFSSDNTAGASPAILQALARGMEGRVPSYGADEVTQRVTERLSALFERPCTVFLVSTGTAANALAIAQLAPSWGGVICHEMAHIAVDECGAPEFFGGGLKLVTLQGADGLIAPDALKRVLVERAWGGQHRVPASVLSLTQASECGTVYTPAMLADLTAIARDHGMRVHMDGARFANALVSLGCTPADISWKAGVDVLSFGATKNGALAAEAVVFFDPAKAEGFEQRRKQGGHLVSKHRVVGLQMDAYLTDDLWLSNARHANAMAARLVGGLSARGVRLLYPVQANEVFPVLTTAQAAKLQAAGAKFYDWEVSGVRSEAGLTPDQKVVRLVTSFATTEAEVDGFLGVLDLAKAA